MLPDETIDFGSCAMKVKNKKAEQLTGSQLSPYRVTFIHTKGNKRRAVPISEELYNELPQNSGRLFSNYIKSFKMAIDRAGNILVLQQILGHASITDTMKYAHFSPTNLEDAIKLNPLSTLKAE